jgi:hypothetical protein
MIRMLLVGYCFGIRSERRLCEEVHLNLAYRWFCRLGPDFTIAVLRGHARGRTKQLLVGSGDSEELIGLAYHGSGHLMQADRRADIDCRSDSAYPNPGDGSLNNHSQGAG